MLKLSNNRLEPTGVDPGLFVPTATELAWLERKRRRDFGNWGTGPSPGLDDPPSVGESCCLIRRRCGIALKEACVLMCVSHVTLIKRERNRGDVPALVSYWMGLGWRLPDA